MNKQIVLPRFRAGYWISPNNHFFTVERHIFSVCDVPAFFGTTEEALRGVFEAFEEVYRGEEHAREVIIRELVRAGWIRLRNYVQRHEDYWSANLPSVETTDLARVCVFMQQVYGETASYAPVYLDAPEEQLETRVELLRQKTLRGLEVISPDALPRLVYLLSPATLPREGIPMIDLTKYAAGEKKQPNNEGTAL